MSDPETRSTSQASDPTVPTKITVPYSEPSQTSVTESTTAGGPTPDPFDAALDGATSDLQSSLTDASQQRYAGENVGQKAMDTVGSFAAGFVKGGVNATNMVRNWLGQPDIAPMDTPILKDIYAQAADMDRGSVINQFADGVGQFTMGLLGAGKVMSVLKIGGEAIAGAPAIVKLGSEVLKGGAAAYAALDPHQARLSNLVQSVPVLRNPVNAFLASDDSNEAMGRLKNAIEGAGVDVATAGLFALGLKVFKTAAKVVQGAAPKAALDTATNELEVAQKEAATTREAGAATDQKPTEPVVAGENKVLPDGTLDIHVHAGKTEGAGDELVSPPADDEGMPNKAAPASDAVLTSSGGNRYEFKVGGQSGYISMHQSGDSIVVDEMYLHAGSQSQADFGALGARNVRKLLKAAQDAFPTATHIEGERVGGARYGGDYNGVAREGVSDTKLKLPGKAADETIASDEGLGNDAVSEPVAAPDVESPAAGVSHQAEQADVDDLVQSYSEDQAALNRYGSRDAAEAAGYQFGQSNLPWQKLTGTEAYNVFHDRVAETFKQSLDDLKGGDVLTDERVNALVAQRVQLFNEDPQEVWGQLRQAGAAANEMVANMEASFAIANKAGDDLYKLTKQIKVGNYEAFAGDEAVAKQALGQRLSLYVEAIGQAQAMRAAFGRGMRRMQGKFQVDPKVLDHINSMDPDAILSMIDLSEGNPRLLAQMATQSFWTRAANATGTMFANNLLWLWPTHVRNMTGNTFMLSATPAMRAVGSFAMGAAGKDVRTIALREYRYMLSSMGDAFDFAKSAYLRGDSVIDPHANEFFRQSGSDMPTTAAGELAASLNMRPMTTVGDVLHNGMMGIAFALHQPTRALGMADEFIKQTSYRASVLAKASLDADKLGITDSKAYQEYLQKALNDAFDESGQAVDKDALYDAQVRTFQQPLLPGLVGGQTIQNIVNETPLTRLVLPFVRTPINLVRYAWKLTPGLNLLSAEYRQMFFGKLGANRMADAYGQMLFGATASASILGMANAGMISGGAPPDPADAKALADTGWKPYSFVTTHPDGSHTYVPFNQVDPIGMLFGIVADIHQIAQQGQVSGTTLDKLVLPVVIATAKNITDRTYLQSLTQTFDALSDPTQSAGRMLGNTAAGLVPFSSLLRGTNPDPYMRDARGLVDSVMAVLPGFSDKLPPRRDAFGDPVRRVTNVVFSDSPNDIVDQEQQRMLTNFGIGVTPPSPGAAGGVDLRTITLPDGQTAFDRYQELAQKPTGAERSLKEALAARIASPEYQALPDGDSSEKGTKLYALSLIVRKYREIAMKQLRAENPVVATQLGARQQAVREAVRNAQAGSDDADARVNTTVSRAISAANRAFGIH